MKKPVLVAFEQENNPGHFKASGSASAVAAIEEEITEPHISCSNCGNSFGPGDHGFSHCRSHKGLRPTR